LEAAAKSTRVVAQIAVIELHQGRCARLRFEIGGYFRVDGIPGALPPHGLHGLVVMHAVQILEGTFAKTVGAGKAAAAVGRLTCVGLDGKLQNGEVGCCCCCRWWSKGLRLFSIRHARQERVGAGAHLRRNGRAVAYSRVARPGGVPIVAILVLMGIHASRKRLYRWRERVDVGKTPFYSRWQYTVPLCICLMPIAMGLAIQHTVCSGNLIDGHWRKCHHVRTWLALRHPISFQRIASFSSRHDANHRIFVSIPIKMCSNRLDHNYAGVSPLDLGVSRAVSTHILGDSRVQNGATWRFAILRVGVRARHNVGSLPLSQK